MITHAGKSYFEAQRYYTDIDSTIVLGQSSTVQRRKLVDVCYDNNRKYMEKSGDNAHFSNSRKRLFCENQLNAYCCDDEPLTSALSAEECIEKIILETYPDMARCESNVWALPMRCFHKDVDYTSVFEDSLSLTIAEKSEEKNDLLMEKFSSFEYSHHMKRPRSLSVLNETASMETDESSYSEEFVHGQFIIDTPTDFDVLCGRGSRTNLHRGNIFWLQEKAKLQKIYLAASKEGKKFISQELIERIRRTGGRFLEAVTHVDGSFSYREVTDRKKLLKKAGQTLRETNDPMFYRSKRERYRKQGRSNSTPW